MRVLFFGPLAERVGTNMLQTEYRPGLSLQDLRDELSTRYPQAFDLVCFTAVDGAQVCDMSLPLRHDSEIAFMAKFSGG